ncbi:MAG: siroheme synthase [Alphaproteobacteria bacterium PA3]|nr:MAG: siroheme synthase [Alphaproteobacteria bacterium PA3]
MLTVRRLNWFQGLGTIPLIFSDRPEPDLSAAAGPDLIPRLPNLEDLAGLQVVWVADLEPDEAELLGAAAREAKVLLNTEDVLPLCDFHTPAIVRRGRLVLSAGTGGGSPAAASYVRERLTATFPEAWAEMLDTLTAERLAQKQAGASMAEMRAAAFAKLVAAFGPPNPSGPI